MYAIGFKIPKCGQYGDPLTLLVVQTVCRNSNLKPIFFTFFLQIRHSRLSKCTLTYKCKIYCFLKDHWCSFIHFFPHKMRPIVGVSYISTYCALYWHFLSFCAYVIFITFKIKELAYESTINSPWEIISTTTIQLLSLCSIYSGFDCCNYYLWYLMQHRFVVSFSTPQKLSKPKNCNLTNVQCCNRPNHSQTIHPTEIFICYKCLGW